MARNSQDRENLLRDATAFTTRVQLILSHEHQPADEHRPAIVFAGFHTAGAVSFYFDQDPVYHFNWKGQLRRAFVDDVLIKAESGRLIGWTRQHSETEVAMLRNEMPPGEQQAFCNVALERLRQLQQTLATGKYEIEGQVQPDDGGEPVLDRLANFLASLDSIQIAESPRVAA